MQLRSVITQDIVIPSGFLAYLPDLIHQFIQFTDFCLCLAKVLLQCVDLKVDT